MGEQIKLRLVANVTYQTNGESAKDIKKRLDEAFLRAVGEGLLTGDSAAEVTGYSHEVTAIKSTKK